MFHIKLDKTNIILLAIAFIFGIGSLLIQMPPGGLFPLVLAVILITFVRTVYFYSGKKVALLMALIFLLIPVAIYSFYYSLTAHTAAAYTIGKVLPWVIIPLVILFGIGLVYRVAKVAHVIISPEKSNKLEEASIIRDVKSNFRFLLEKGYKISQVYYVNHPLAGWHFQLDSPDDKLSLILDQQELPVLAFGLEKTDKGNRIYLEAMIYHLTGRKVFIEHTYETFSSRSEEFKRIAKLLKTYIDQIETFARGGFETTNNDLSNLQKQYVDLLTWGFEHRHNLPPENTGPIVLPIVVTVHWAWKLLYAVGIIIFLSLSIGVWFSLHMLPMACGMGLFALLGIYVFLLSFTAIQVDEKSLMIAAPHGVYRIDWADVTAIETNTIDGMRFESNDEVFVFMGESKCLPINFKFAGKGKAEFLRFFKQQIKQLQIPVKPLTSKRLSQKNTLISRFGFW